LQRTKRSADSKDSKWYCAVTAPELVSNEVDYSVGLQDMADKLGLTSSSALAVADVPEVQCSDLEAIVEHLSYRKPHVPKGLGNCRVVEKCFTEMFCAKTCGPIENQPLMGKGVLDEQIYP
jgi:hypothetical protein